MADENPTLAKLLPPTVRAWVYALLAIGNPVYLAAAELYDLPTWSSLIVVGLNAGGFTMAFTKTP